MVVFDDSGETAKIGRIFYPDGRPAFGPKEREEAIQQKKASQERARKRVQQQHLNKAHPIGLCELRNADGSVQRRSGTLAETD